MDKDVVKRICLWSGPRNISTTLMYSFAQRSDTKVFDEPLYGYYLSHSDAKQYHPGAEDIIRAMENDGQKIVDMMLVKKDKPVLFFKNMTKHLLDLDLDFTKKMINVILTRDPKEMLPSFDKVIHNPTVEDVGYKNHIELITYFKANNIQYLVLDSKKVLLNPERVLRKLCKIIGIQFKDNMLHWEHCARVEDGIWAKYWYKSIHKSKGYIKYKPKNQTFPIHLIPLLEASRPYYLQLLNEAL